MVTHISIQEAASAIEVTYTKAQMQKGIEKFVRNFLQDNQALVKKEGVSDGEWQLLYVKSPNKAELSTLMAIPFASETLFKAFRDTLSDRVQNLIEVLLWRDSISNKEVKEKFKYEIYTIGDDQRHYRVKSHALLPEFEFFLNKGNENLYRSFSEPLFNLSLGSHLQKIIRRYYPLPKGATFLFLDEIEKTDYIFEGEMDILREFPRLDAYATQGQIKTTANGKVSAATLAKLQKKVGIKEFYPEEDVKFMKTLRSNLLASIIAVQQKKSTGLEIHEQILYLFKNTFLSNYISPVGVLSYFKGMSGLDSREDISNVQAFLKAFHKLSVNKWVTAKNFTEYLQFNSLDNRPVSYYFSSEKIFFEYEIEFAYSGRRHKEKSYIYREDYRSCVLLPFQQGMCYLFAAHGLLDIAYNSIDFSKPGDSANSPYDGLKYLRLTSLGAYVLGLTENYELPESFSKSITILSEDSLTITADAKDTTAPMVLEPYAVRVSPNRYRTDFSFFLKGIKNKRELEAKITLFKQAVKVELPNNWIEFFKELNQKIDPLIKFGAVKVFEIPKENTELLKLIARDPILQKHSMKAENYHILVPNKSMATFRNRLREFGYLLT